MKLLRVTVGTSVGVAVSGKCPASHPWAYRPRSDFDYCCATADDYSQAGANMNPDRSRRSDSCKNNDYMPCAAPPCADYWTAACPEIHPWAYRPLDGFDYCCASGDDHFGRKGINSLANRSARSDSCKDEAYVPCSSPPCDDYSEQSQITLADNALKVVVNTNTHNGLAFGTVTYLAHPTSAQSLVAASTAMTAWSAAFVTEGSTKAITKDSSSSATRMVALANATHLSLVWSGMTIADAGFVDVYLALHLKDGFLHHRLKFETTSPTIGLWDWTLVPGGTVLLPETATTFENAGFGVVHTPPLGFQGVYPQQTMQYMASFENSHFSGMYVAAHDPDASSKTLGLSVTNGNGHFTIGATPPGAGEPFAGYETDFDIVVSAFDGGWWEASQIYRNWALREATWTKQGPMSQRPDVPEWLYDVTTWVNSHWQGNDIFNVTGGDPVVVQQRVTAIFERFGLAANALALHWYEWDTLGYKLGSNYSECATEVTCGFDTHYPEYFPVRERFEESLKAMQDLGVKVCPYINGRIFDKSTETWTKMAAEDFASKSAIPSLHTPEISTYEEQYGSMAKFAVMCPHTAYWQDTIADTVGRLTNEYNTDGVYIDQIAAAGPKACFDKSHNHSVGGGHHWVTGYAEMLRKVRAQAGNDKVILTESNSEPFMGGLNLFLTLVGFLIGDLPSTPEPTTGSIIVPAFQSVYGGYILPVGAEFYQQDFKDPNIFAAKVAVMYVFGAQMGWFSLGGRDNEHPPMGIHELLMDAEYDQEILYLRKLSQAKLVAKKWFNHGRVMRPLDLEVNASSSAVQVFLDHYRGHKEKEVAKVGIAFGLVMSSAWLSSDERDLLLTLTTVQRDMPATVGVTLDVSRYGLKSDEQYDVRLMPVDGSPERSLGVFPGAAVRIRVALTARDVLLLRIEPLVAVMV